MSVRFESVKGGTIVVRGCCRFEFWTNMSDGTWRARGEFADGAARPLKRLRARSVPRRTEDLFGSDSSSDAEPEAFTVRVGDVVLINLGGSKKGRLLATEVNDESDEVSGYWFYGRDELPSGLSEHDWVLSVHHQTNALSSVEETCRPLDWLSELSGGLDPFLYDPGSRELVPRFSSKDAIGWAAAAHCDPTVARENVLNQVGPLVGGKYGQVIDELALCGSASRTNLGSKKHAVISAKLPIVQRRSSRGRTGTCWACSSVKPLSATIGDHEIGSSCADKLQRLEALTACFEAFLTAPYTPERALEFIEEANLAV